MSKYIFMKFNKIYMEKTKLKKIYKKANCYIKEHHLLKWTIYLLKNNKCYKAEDLLKRLHENLKQWSYHAPARKQFISEYNEIIYIYRIYGKKVPTVYSLNIEDDGII
jgi:hypothetical protein